MAFSYTLGSIQKEREVMADQIKVAIVGSGGWGTAAALLWAKKSDHHTSLWVPRLEAFRELQAKRENLKYLAGVPIPENIALEHENLTCLKEAHWWVIATPAAFLDTTLTQLRQKGIPCPPKILSLVKGMDPVTGERPSTLLARWAIHDRIVVLSGPSHAEEVARGLPASLVAASTHPELAKEIQTEMGNPRFRIYTSPDEIGVEWAGVHKNVIGIAAGICAGLGLGDNAVSALLTRGLAEMARWGVSQGGQPETFMGLAGMGDLITTCFSPHGRNRKVGLMLASGNSIEQIQKEMQKVAEGVNSARILHQKAIESAVPLPITEAVFRVIYEGVKPQIAVEQLLQRTPRSETDFANSKDQ